MRLHLGMPFALLVLVGASVASSVPILAGGAELADVVEKVEPSVVRIDTNRGIGSGVIVDDKGRVITNYHVIAGAREAKVRFKNRRVAQVAGYAAIDPARDLALLQLEDDHGQVGADSACRQAAAQRRARGGLRQSARTFLLDFRRHRQRHSPRDRAEQDPRRADLPGARLFHRGHVDSNDGGHLGRQQRRAADRHGGQAAGSEHLERYRRTKLELRHRRPRYQTPDRGRGQRVEAAGHAASTARRLGAWTVQARDALGARVHRRGIPHARHQGRIRGLQRAFLHGALSERRTTSVGRVPRRSLERR